MKQTGRETSTQPTIESELTRQVLASFEETVDPRLKEIFRSGVTHLHAFLRELRLTEEEWQKGIEFLTAVGQLCDEQRQEFILLSDTLGASMQTIAINNETIGGATEATVFGPFFVSGSPRIDLGADIANGAPGEPCWVEGSVTDLDGAPITNARVEVWEADDEGYYDVQYNDGRVSGRAHLFSDEAGNYRFWGVTPTPYPIPADGPVGRMLAAAGRSPMRASHLHFMVTAPGFRRLVTHVFVAGDPYLGSDSVFGVKESLVLDFGQHSSGTPTPDGRDLQDQTWREARFDIVLWPEEA